MTGTAWREVIPEWVVPPVDDVAEYGGMAVRLEKITECVQARGQCAALCWLIGRAPAPITRRQGLVSRDAARWESWLALCLAAGRPGAVEEERARLGIPQRRTDGQVPWWAHGVWRTLSWVSGEHPDPPIQLPVWAADGSILPGTEVYTVTRNPESPSWRAAEERRERRELAEAVEWWRNVCPATVPSGR